MGNHLADILNLPVTLKKKSVIWDAAHRLELGCEHAKTGYMIDGQMTNGTKWLIELDSAVAHHEIVQIWPQQYWVMEYSQGVR